MKNYSDLAAECRELDPNSEELKEEVVMTDGVTVRRVTVSTDRTSEVTGRPKGRYSTLEAPEGLSAVNSERISHALVEELSLFLPEGDGCVIVAGLGNRAVTPDALGPRVASKIIATRHITEELANRIGLKGLKSVAVVAPGVLGQTGIETAETVKSAVDTVHPRAVLTIDALTARSVDRLCTTIQITDSGISPGSGVGNRRAEISQGTVGVPVISIGIPTVVNASTIAGKESGDENDMIVTPKDIDSLIESASSTVALAVNCLLQPSVDIATIRSCM